MLNGVRASVSVPAQLTCALQIAGHNRAAHADRHRTPERFIKSALWRRKVSPGTADGFDIYTIDI